MNYGDYRFGFKSSLNSFGFTIVELLVVIVVIGILASVTIVSYTGVTNRANIAVLQSDLSSAAKQLKVFQTTDANGNYPTANVCPTPGPTEICLKASRGNVFSYTSNGTSYTLTETSANGTVYNITDTTTVAVGSLTTYYTLTIAAGSNGTVNTVINGSYASGSTPTITAIPNANYMFSSWSGDTGCSGSDSHTITIDADKSCTANFIAPAVNGDYLQTIASTKCPSTRIRAVDARDNHTYWVQKLADGKCWMLTNLGYAGGGTNTYSDTKALTNGTGGSITFTVASYYVTPSTTNFTTEPTAPSISTDGTGQYGYLYNWCAATGGDLASSGCSNTITTPLPVTTASICPSGWRLPTSNGGEFTALNAAINGGSTTTDAGLIGSPWLAQRVGSWGSGFFNQGDRGYYWSSTQSTAANAYSLYLNSASVNPSSSKGKGVGNAVRCVAI